VIEAGTHKTGLTLTLVRGGVITGELRDARGRAIQDMTVRARRFGFRDGARALVAVPDVAPAITDDRGIYRIFGLPPGEYVVSVTVPESAAETSTRLTTADDVRRARQLIQSGRGGPALTPPPSVPLAPAVTITYADSHHPNTTSLDDARLVRVGAGEERAGIDLQLLFIPTADLEGAVLDAAGRPARNARVWMRSATGAVDRGVRLRAAPNGTFTATRVPPGDYLIAAEAAPADATSPAAGAGPDRTHWARLNVSVSGSNQQGLTLRLQPGVRISGRVVFDAESGSPPGAAGVRLSLFEDGVDRWYTIPTAATNPDGSFAFEGVAAARYRVVVQPISNWTLLSIGGAAHDLADVPLDVRAGSDISDLTVTFSARTSELAGTLQDAAGRPATLYTVVVFSADRAFWTPQSRRIRAVRPADDGRYSVGGLPAGEYRLAAVTDVEDGQWFDPRFLAGLGSASVPVTIAAGQRTLQDLQIAKAP
jgi:hypothetical protein